MRRVSLDRVLPADQYHDASEEEIDKNDVENHERLLDDSFENVDILVDRNKEIEQLKKENLKQKKQIIELEKKSVQPKSRKASHHVALPKLYKNIRFQLDGIEDFKFGKVIHRNKAGSIHKNKVRIELEDGSTE